MGTIWKTIKTETDETDKTNHKMGVQSLNIIIQ